MVRCGSIGATSWLVSACRTGRCMIPRRVPRYSPAGPDGPLIPVVPAPRQMQALMRRVTAERPTRPNRRANLRVIGPRREIEHFELLVDELSAVMSRTPAHAVDGEIETWLGKISQALGLDRSGIYERDSSADHVRAAHTWKRTNIPPLPPDFEPEKYLKTTTDWVLAGNQVVFSSPNGIPAELTDAKQFVERYGLKASAIIPMWAGNRVIGAGGFDKFRAARKWPPKLLEQLTLAVRLFGSAIERKQAETERRATLAQLRVASRRNMMSELVASLAHEINQPLGAILSNLGGLARLLSKNNPEPAIALAAVNNAIEDTKRAAEIIRRIRFMFKAHPEHKTAVGIGALAGDVVSLIASEAALRKVLVLLEVSPAVKRVIGDRILLQQCLLNLLMNGFDAITESKSDQREITIKIAAEKSRWAAISVRDTGGGIHPSVANRLFEPFVTTKNNGMGLGLLVTRSIVENHGGKIWATPNPDRGTTFTFTLPLVQRKRSSP
jgi:signal transduction histidine kinase